MIEEANKTVRSIVRLILRPLVSMLLKCGMTWKEFADMSKAVFVETASAEYGLSGRPTNVSRVAILTGISRKEVKRQRELLEDAAAPLSRKTNDATRVLSGWFQDPGYLDQDGNPITLREAGKGASFASLCAAYAGDIAAATMLKELLKTNSVQRLRDDSLQVVSRYYQPAQTDDENLLFAADRIHDVIATMNNNVFPGEHGALRFGGFADNEAVPESMIPKFREFLDVRGQAFLEEVDNWLTDNVRADDVNDEPTARVGVSLFATQRKNFQE